MLQPRSEEPPPTGTDSPTSFDPSVEAAPPRPSLSDLRPADQPSPPPSPDPPASPAPADSPKGYRGLPDPVDPRLLLIANPDGSLKPEFQDWEADLQLEAGSLVPTWWPQEQDGQVLTPKEREESFAVTLDALLSSSPPPSPSSSATSPASASASPTKASSKPQAVLKSLLRLRSAVRPE